MRNLIITGYRLFMAALFSFVLLTSGIAGENETSAKNLITTYNSDTTMIKNASMVIIKNMSHDLKGELMAAVKKGGPAAAVHVCHTRAPEIAANYVTDNWYISRLTDKSRNKNNQVDSTQMEILKKFQDTATAEILTWDPDPTDSGLIFHYYKPIRTGELCLNCHGKENMLSPDVAGKLNELYPDDSARGYEVGELRGMFVVEAEWPEGREHAEKLLKSNKK